MAAAQQKASPELGGRVQTPADDAQKGKPTGKEAGLLAPARRAQASVEAPGMGGQTSAPPRVTDARRAKCGDLLQSTQAETAARTWASSRRERVAASAQLAFRVLHQVVFGCPSFCRKLGVYLLGISRRKVNIFWDDGDFPYGARDILAPQPGDKNWPPEE